MRPFSVLLASAVALGGLFASVALHAQTVPPNYELQWSDTFDGTALDASKWNYRTDTKVDNGITGAQLPSNISVDGNNHLNISLNQQHLGAATFTGGGIVSKAAFRYGYYEVQAKTTANYGWHSAFWLFAGTGTTTYVTTSSTEIDDFEINSDPNAATTNISMGVIEWANGGTVPGGSRCNTSKQPNFNTDSGYHTYGVEWTEQTVTYYLDGQNICSQSYPPTQHTHDLVNIWLTAIPYLSGVSVANNPSPTSFAGVAYYVRDYYIGNNETGYAEYGNGWNNSALPGYSGLPSRYSCSAGAVAMWTPTILAPGNYDVQVYQISDSGSDHAAQLSVTYNGGTATRTVDFTSGPSGWVDLGTYPFAAGSQGFLTNTNSGSGCTRASMVKFVRR